MVEITLTKDPDPPASQTDVSPVTIPDGTTVITTKNLNDFIDKMGGKDPLASLRALQTDSDGNLQVSSVTATELGYVSGVTSAIQTQINNKQASNSDLTAIAGLSPSNDDIIQRKGGAWTNRTVSQFKSDLSLTKSDVGLGNADNTSDANKPISTATQSALDAKASITYVDDEIASALTSDLTLKGDYNASTNSPDLDTSPSGILKGDYYVVTVAGTFFTESVAIGDSLIAKQDDPTTLDHWILTSQSLTAVEIKTLYESNSDTNAFTDAEKTLLSNQSGTNTGDEPDADTTTKGIVELATSSEVNTGTDATRAITPDALKNSSLQSKVDGIEANADVTDATNVDSAGATMNSDTSLVGNGYFLDEDTMSSDSASKVPSQQSVVAFVNAKYFTDVIPCVMEVAQGTVAYPDIHALATATAKVSGWVLPDVTLSTVNFKCVVPSNLSTSPNAKFRFRLMAQSSLTDKDIRLTSNHKAVADSGNLDQALVNTSSSGEETVRMPNTIEYIKYYTATFQTQPTAGDTIVGQIVRDPADAVDNFTGNILLIGVELIIDRKAT